MTKKQATSLFVNH